MAFSWLGPFREPIRRATYDFLRQALDTDDGRAILSRALEGQLAEPNAVTDIPLELVRTQAYADLGRTPSHAERRAPPVFITARFRSGSTLLWNLFRQVDEATAYYEPLNERRWFDPSTRGARIDATHIGVSDYWREYEGLDSLIDVYDERWIDRRLYMDRRDDDPRLKRYITALIDAAPQQAVLQFNRVDFRLGWLRATFPSARVVHLYRHPRDQWCSSLVDIRTYPADAPPDRFEPHDHFYLLPWVRDLGHHFPFLRARVEHPYQLFYFIWKLSYVFGRHYADASFCFEELVANPDGEIRRLMAVARSPGYDLNRLKQVIVGQKPGKWRHYAEPAWFERHEAACERVLEDFFAARRGGVGSVRTEMRTEPAATQSPSR